MPVLRCRGTIFYSQLDEAMFFEALDRISAVTKYEGKGLDLFLTVPSRMSGKAARELDALFRRYKVDRRQLGPYLKESS